jgi:predicted nucleic acid-binding Zn ribbon protein
MNDPPLTHCPECHNSVRRIISAPAVGASKSGFDDRAKAAGFHKLERRGKGEYEKTY